MKELLTVALEVVNKVLPMFPNYEQKEKKSYEELIYNYKKELESEHPDLHLLGVLGDQLLCKLRDIRAQVGSK